MATKVDTRRVQELLDRGAQLVDVLPRDTFLEEHLPGAINIPLEEIDAATGSLDSDRPVVVYCYDYQCDLSPRAAANLERLGFDDVYDYVASKVAWLANGLPGAGQLRDERRAGSRVLTGVPTLPPTATVRDLLRVVADWEVAVIVDESRVVLGIVRSEAVDAPDDVELVKMMHTAPSSVRPSIPLRELASSMDRNGEQHTLVTTLDGVLSGLVRRGDLDKV